MTLMYRKKPVVIEAIKLSNDNVDEVLRFCSNSYISGMGNNLIIKTLEGSMVANFGDYIIKGIKGEFYPCKPDIFESTYEKINA